MLSNTFISNLACSFSVTVSGGGHWGITKTVKLQQNVPETVSKIVENRNHNAREGGGGGGTQPKFG